LGYRFCILSEGLGGTQDEGMRNFVSSLSGALGIVHSVRAISLDTGLGIPGEVKTNRLLLSGHLRRVLTAETPDLILYIPLASSTLGSFFRARSLRFLSPAAPVVMVALQPRTHSPWKRTLIRWLHPNAFFAQDSSSVANLPPGFPAGTLPSGVDIDRFKPVDREEKSRIRQALGIGESDFVLLHVGHIRRERQVAIMGTLARTFPCHPILVGSTSTEQDGELARELEEAGVRVIRERVPEIERFYQAADCYLFPVHSDQAAIEMPLSVLEAMAVNLPVISTRFGALPQHFPEGSGICYFRGAEEVPPLLENMAGGTPACTREQVAAFSWENVAAGLVRTLEDWALLRGKT